MNVTRRILCWLKKTYLITRKRLCLKLSWTFNRWSQISSKPSLKDFEESSHSVEETSLDDLSSSSKAHALINQLIQFIKELTTRCYLCNPYVECIFNSLSNGSLDVCPRLKMFTSIVMVPKDNFINQLNN